MAAIVIQSDFGMGAGVAAIKGVCKGAAEGFAMFDLTHDIPPLNIEAAAASLSRGMFAWPKGTVFLSVVDDGANNHPIKALRTLDGYIAVAPDNGTFAAIEAEHGIAAEQDVTYLAREYAKREKTALCHGRDIAYAAAMVASAL